MLLLHRLHASSCEHTARTSLQRTARPTPLTFGCKLRPRKPSRSLPAKGCLHQGSCCVFPGLHSNYNVFLGILCRSPADMTPPDPLEFRGTESQPTELGSGPVASPQPLHGLGGKRHACLKFRYTSPRKHPPGHSLDRSG